MYKIIGADEKEYGPVSMEQIREWLNQGRLNRQTRVRTEGTSEWRAIEAVPAFASALGAMGAPPVMALSAPPSSDSGINVIIPYRNMQALIAYYLAVFSLIPFVGIVLGLAALVLGILGLRYHRDHPTAGGVVHAWIGIILGGLCGCGYLGLTVYAVMIVKRI